MTIDISLINFDDIKLKGTTNKYAFSLATPSWKICFSLHSPEAANSRSSPINTDFLVMKK